MLRIQTALVLGLLAGCTSPDRASEAVSPSSSAEAAPTSGAHPVLDPSDPHVLRCPVTGALRHVGDADGSVHGGDGYEDSY